MPNPRTPTVLKALRGTTRADRAHPDEPDSPALEVGSNPPAWVKGSDARRAWATLIKIAPRGLITTMDTVALGVLVSSFADWLEARRVVEKEGRYYRTTSKDGAEMIRSHPAVADAAEARRFLRLLLKDFAMTPVDRSRAETGDEHHGDPTEDFLSGRRSA